MCSLLSSQYTTSWVERFRVSGIHLEDELVHLFKESFRVAFPALQPTPKVLMAPGKVFDYQINNSLSLAKQLSVPVTEVMAMIIKNVPENTVIDTLEADPKGFLHVNIAKDYLRAAVEYMSKHGYSVGEKNTTNARTILCDFSSPNIAKDMHVGHLRSTIIGDCLSKIYEFTGHTVHRVNHVGDWGTQFGMLIAYLKQEYPTFETNPPEISDLAAFYKRAKSEFDSNEAFKSVAYKEVIALQGKDVDAVRAWTVLCDISRKEFQSVYDRLHITLTEVGESFYCDKIPIALQLCDEKKLTTTLPDGAKVIMPVDTIPIDRLDAKALRRIFLHTFFEFKKETELHQLIAEELNLSESILQKGTIPLSAKTKEETKIDAIEWQMDGDKVYKLIEKKLLSSGSKMHPKMAHLLKQRGVIIEEVARVPRFEYPLILVKRDGGFTYDTTDLAAVYYRSQVLQVDHIVYVTDVGQSGHFQLIFSAAEDLGFVQEKGKLNINSNTTTSTTVEHVGFGLVTGEDGKRLRTRSGDTVRLKDLLDEAVQRCYEITVAREKEHPQGHREETMRHNAEILGIAAIKYYDLRQHRASDYAFSYDKMCDLNGNTALYLLYTYVRICGIFRKAEKSDEEKMTTVDLINIDHPNARALSLHLCRLGGVLSRVLEESMPSRLTEYSFQLVSRFSDFYAQQQILGNVSNMKLCKVTGEILKLSLHLLGIDVLERL